MSTNIFEKASRNGLRFVTVRGAITTEELWGLPLTSARGISLNAVAQNISREIKANGEEDFVGAGNPKSKALSLAMDVVKHIIAVRLEENKAKTDAKANETHNNNIDKIIEQKKTDDMKGMSIEDLEKLRR